MPAASAACSFWRMAASARPSGRTLDHARQQHRGSEQAERQQHIHMVVGKLHERGAGLPLHRQRDFLVAEPFEDREQRQRVGQHRQREVMATQAERRQADQQSRDRAQHTDQRDAEPGRQPPADERERHAIGAEAEERGVTEGDQAGVAAEQVPRQGERRPHRHQRHQQQVIRIGQREGGQRPAQQEHDDRQQAAPQRRDGERARGFAHHTRSATRPNRPCGRRNTTSRNTTKIAVF